MERYFICASANSMLKMTASGCPLSTGEPNSTDTCRTMPPTSALTLVSRYALDMTVPGTVMADIEAPLRTTAVLIPARSAASGVRDTSTVCSSDDGPPPCCALPGAIPGIPGMPAPRLSPAAGPPCGVVAIFVPLARLDPRSSPHMTPTPSTALRPRPDRLLAIEFSERVFVLIHHPLRSATRRADGPLNLHRGVIDLLQRVRVAVLGLDVATLLGDDVEKRAPTQFIALPNDVQVPTRDVADAALVDLPAPPCRFILHERRLDLLAYRERRELHAPLRGVRLRPRGRDVALVPVADWEHDAHAAAEVVEDVLDWARLPLSRRTHEVEAEVLAHVTQVHAGVPATFCLLLQDPRPRRRGVGTGRFEVCPAGQRPRDRLTTIGDRYRRAEIAAE